MKKISYFPMQLITVFMIALFSLPAFSVNKLDDNLKQVNEKTNTEAKITAACPPDDPRCCGPCLAAKAAAACTVADQNPIMPAGAAEGCGKYTKQAELKTPGKAKATD